MGRREHASGDSTGNVPLLLRLQSLSDPSVSDYIAKSKAKYGKYLLPVDDVRHLIDESMGRTTLTEILTQMREGQR